MRPDIRLLREAMEATWPPARRFNYECWTIREGLGGGKRVSAATLRGNWNAENPDAAVSQMAGLGQRPLFMVWEGEGPLDNALAELGYRQVDPVNAYACALRSLPKVEISVPAMAVWEPLAVQLDIWRDGNIGAERIEVMRRVQGLKTSFLGRCGNSPAATLFVAIHNDISIIHALQVRDGFRRAGMGRHLTLAAARWAERRGAKYLSVLCTTANEGANALYDLLGMKIADRYHYRIKEETRLK